MGTVTAAHDMIDLLIEEMEKIRERARRLTAALTPRQLGWSPPEGGWSVGQVLEHLLISDESYVVPMRRHIDRARAEGRTTSVASWRSTLAGRFLIKSLGPSGTRKLPAPKIYRPGPTPRADVVAAYLRNLDEIESLLRGSRGVDLGRLRMASPVSRLIRLHVGDGFSIIAVHAQRHLGQIERIQATPGYPAG
jgi:hypothetical protein